MEQSNRAIFEENFTNFVHNIPNDLKEWIKARVLSFPSLSNQATLSLEAVVDTNIIFQQVRAKMLNGNCFIEKLLDNPALILYAPRQLEIEIFQKIEKKFPKEKKTKSVNISKAKEFAAALLNKIIINDDYAEKALSKATDTLGERDPKDITFLALTISHPKHGIITADKDLKDIDEVQTWSLGEVGGILTKLNKGELSIVIIHDLLPKIFEIGKEVIALLWKNMVDSAVKLAKGTISLLKAGSNIVGDAPTVIKLALAFGVGYAEFKHSSISSFISKILNTLKKAIEIFRPIYDFFTYLFKVTLLTSVMLLDYTQQALVEVSVLEQQASRHNLVHQN